MPENPGNVGRMCFFKNLQQVIDRITAVQATDRVKNHRAFFTQKLFFFYVTFYHDFLKSKCKRSTGAASGVSHARLPAWDQGNQHSMHTGKTYLYIFIIV